MTATVLPADGMIDVLSDAIASKRDTISLLERAAKEAQADLQHLREVRAVRLARAAGLEVGQVRMTTATTSWSACSKVRRQAGDGELT